MPKVAASTPQPALASPFHPAVDAYIARSAPFAQPILHHVRALLHQAVPGVQEEMKWSRPFFVFHGVILGNVSAFKAHCSVGLWGQEMAEKLRADGIASKDGMGTLGKIAALTDLPSDKVLLSYLKHAASVITDGTRTKSMARPANRVAKPLAEVPAELAVALSQNPAAQATFQAFPPSCRKEYIDWVADAKRDETRARRVQEAVAMMAEGKRRHWKYESR